MNQLNSKEVTEIQSLLELRAFAYDILRRTFLEEPSKELVAQFHNGILHFFPFIEENQLLKDGVELIQNYFNDYMMEENFEELHWDYTRMFIGPYELPALMWESSYVNKDGLLFQEETWRVRRMYLQNNLESLQYGREADDHLGLELDFMYQLSKVAIDLIKGENASSLRGILENQSYFLKAHLLQWTPAFADKVIEHSETDFYKGMVKVLNGFLVIDKSCLEEIISQISE